MHAQGSPLDDRKQRILRAIVVEYVHTAEPVGSEALALHYNFGVRSATVRNEMAEMADMGYLRQPHTSAGRVPSDLGYRFFVDRLMGTPILPRREALGAREKLSTAASELDYIISQSCRILSGLTRYTSVATQPAACDAVISHISLSRVGGQKLVLVVVLSDGRVEHRIIDAGGQVTESQAIRASNLLASRFVGRAVSAVGGTEDCEAPSDTAAVGRIWGAALSVLYQVAESLSLTETDVYVEGTNCILKQPEFQDRTTLERVLALLEERKQLYQVLSRIVLGPDVTVLIGTENPFPRMHDTSFVGAKYRIGERVAGTIGVIGPTRMDYQRAVAAVEAMACNLSDLLTLLSLS